MSSATRARRASHESVVGTPRVCELHGYLLLERAALRIEHIARIIRAIRSTRMHGLAKVRASAGIRDSMAAIRPAPSWRIRSAFAAGALASTLAGCSLSQELVGAPHPGLQQDGTYVVSQQEQDRGCRALQDRSLGLQQHMQTLSVQAVEQMQQLPGTVAAGWQRLVGAPGDGVPAIAEYKEAQAESAALNRTMTAKGCNGSAPATASAQGSPAATSAQIPPFETSAPALTAPAAWGAPVTTASIPH